MTGSIIVFTVINVCVCVLEFLPKRIIMTYEEGVRVRVPSLPLSSGSIELLTSGKWTCGLLLLLLLPRLQ